VTAEAHWVLPENSCNWRLCSGTESNLYHSGCDNFGANPRNLMKRHVLIYGLIGGILIAALKSTEYQFRFPKVPVPSGHKFLAHWAWDPATGATSASQEGVAVYPVSVEGEDVFGKV
jgi:hypothetical protein